MERRLEDRIRMLCNAAIQCRDTNRLYTILDELRDALRDHIHRVRTLAEAKLMAGLSFEERRRAIRTLEKFENSDEESEREAVFA